MVLFNPLSYLIDFEFTRYIYVAFAFFGVFLLIRKIIFKRRHTE